MSRSGWTTYRNFGFPRSARKQRGGKDTAVYGRTTYGASRYAAGTIGRYGSSRYGMCRYGPESPANERCRYSRGYYNRRDRYS